MKKLDMEPRLVVVTMICDCCGHETSDKNEMPEWLSYSNTAGYDAKFFRDMDHMEIDLCEQCKKNLLGKYMRITPHEDSNDWEVDRLQ